MHYGNIGMNNADDEDLSQEAVMGLWNWTNWIQKWLWAKTSMTLSKSYDLIIIVTATDIATTKVYRLNQH